MSPLNDQNFTASALRTEVDIPDTYVDRQTMRQLHAAIGISTEAGELLDAYKKSLFYGTDLDLVNVNEEAGDLLWYIALLLDSIGESFEVCSATVINKLKVRYPEKFTQEAATDRDIEAEREALDSTPPEVTKHKTKKFLQVHERRDILALLGNYRASVAEIAELYDVSVSTIYRLKSELIEAGLLNG